MIFAAGGMVRQPSGEPRWWGLSDTHRQLHVLTESRWATVGPPIPGTSRVLACDPWPERAVLTASADVYRLSEAFGTPPVWRYSRNLVTGSTEGPMERSEVLLVEGGCEQPSRGTRVFWGLSPERVVLIGDVSTGRFVAVGLPLPGRARVLGVEVGQYPRVLTNDGKLWVSSARGWSAFDAMAGVGDGLIAVRALKSFCYEFGKDCEEGDVLRLEPRRAKSLVEMNCVAYVEAEVAS
jgi:hypothetical protein